MEYTLNSDSDMIPVREEAKLTEDNPSIHGAVDPALCIFETKAADMAIQGYYIVECKPVSSISNQSVIEIDVPASTQYYWNLKRSYLSLKVRLLNSLGKPISITDKVGMVQAPGFSLFKSGEVLIDQISLCQGVGDHYAIKNILDLLLYAPQEYLESKAQTFLFYKDNAPMDGTDVSSQAGVNNGLVERYEYSARGNEVDIQVPIGHDIWTMDNYIPTGVAMRVKLKLQENEYVLMTNTSTERYSYEITSCKLKMYGLIPTSQAIAKHAQLLSRQKAIFHYTRSELKTKTIAYGMNEFEIDQMFSNRIPYEVILVCMNTSAYRGNYKQNPYNFKHHDISYVGLTIEGCQTMEFTPNFSTYECADEYNALYDKDEPFASHGNIIKRSEFHNGYAIFRFNIAPAAYDRPARPKKGQMSFKVKMSQSVESDTLTALVYGRFHDYFLLDKDKKVHLSN